MPFRKEKSTEVDVSDDNDDDDYDDDDSVVKDQDEEDLDIIQELKNLNIQLIHKVPQQHKIETDAVSQIPNKEQRILFKKYQILRRGKFTVEEDNIIRKNWNLFCSIHKWDEENVKPFVYIGYRRKCHIIDHSEKQKFVQFLANGLSSRTLNSIYKRFLKLFNQKSQNKRRFTKAEDQEILVYLKDARKPNEKLAVLSRILGKDRHSIWNRYQILKASVASNFKKKEKYLREVTWTFPLIEKFLQHLMNLTLSEEIEELKDAIIPDVVWEEIERKIQIDEILLRDLWFNRLHIQLFSVIPINETSLKIRLIESLNESRISDYQEINWPEVYDKFNGFTVSFIDKLFYQLKRYAKMRIASRNLTDIVDYLYEEVIPKLKEKSEREFLPRLIFEDGSLRYFAEENEGETEDFHSALIRQKKRELNNSDRLSVITVDTLDNINWTLLMREKFIRELLKVTLSEDLNELKDAVIPEIVWSELESRLNMSQKALKRIWYFELHLQLFCPVPISMNDIKIGLIKYFHMKNISHPAQVIWSDVCKYFDGLTIFFLFKTTYQLIDETLKSINSDNFLDIVDYLLRVLGQKLLRKSMDDILPRLLYVEGSLKFNKNDIKEVKL